MLIPTLLLLSLIHFRKGDFLILATAEEVDTTVCGCAVGSGNGLSLNIPIPTPDGWTTIGELNQGHIVFGSDGNTCNVLEAGAIMFNRTCFGVVFSDESYIIADADHLWLTMCSNERKQATRRTLEYREHRRATRPKRGKGKRPDLAERNSKQEYKVLLPPRGSIRSTQEIKNTLKVYNGREINHSIDVASPLVLPDRSLPIDPYVLGVWLGDGNTNSGVVTSADIEIFSHFSNVDYTWHKLPSAKFGYRIDGLTSQLKAVGVLGNKHIPMQYLRSSMSQRLSLLQGLMDTDGYCDTRGQCEFTTTIKTLALEMHELVCTLGIKVNISKGKSKLNGKVCGEKYRLKFLNNMPVFKLTRKLNRQKRNEFRGTHNRRYILAVNIVPSVPVRCIRVDSPDNSFLAGTSMISII